MRRIAIVFTQPSQGSAIGREALDMVLATSALTENIDLFFIADGILQLVSDQQADKILARDYIATFGVLELYDIHRCYLCQDSVEKRGLPLDTSWVINTEYLSRELIRQKLSTYNVILTF